MLGHWDIVTSPSFVGHRPVRGSLGLFVATDDLKPRPTADTIIRPGMTNLSPSRSDDFDIPLGGSALYGGGSSYSPYRGGACLSRELSSSIDSILDDIVVDDCLLGGRCNPRDGVEIDGLGAVAVLIKSTTAARRRDGNNSTALDSRHLLRAGTRNPPVLCVSPHGTE